jgi:hypothetical protein
MLLVGVEVELTTFPKPFVPLHSPVIKFPDYLPTFCFIGDECSLEAGMAVSEPRILQLRNKHATLGLYSHVA